MDVEMKRITTIPSKSDVEDRRKKFRITLEPVGFFFIMALIIQSLATPNLYLYKVCHVNFNYSAEVCNPQNQTAKFVNSHYNPITEGNYSQLHNNQTDKNRLAIMKYLNSHYNTTGNISQLIRNMMMNGTLRQQNGQKNLSGIKLVNAVQIYVAQLETYMAIITNIPSIFFILFLGPWSDKHGRKPLLIVPMIGFIVATLIHMLNYYEESWPAEYNLIANAFIGFLGGQVTFHMAATRYMIDVTNEENRTWRLALLGGILGVSAPLSFFLGSYIYQYGGPWASWGTSVGLASWTVIYTFFFLEESATSDDNKVSPMGPIFKEEVVDESSLTKYKKECSTIMENMWLCFSVTFKRRQGYVRACICLLLAATLIGHFIKEPHGVLYLYTRKMFSWDSPDFARYVTITSIVTVLGTLFVLPVLSRYLKWKDSTIGSISMLGNIGSAFMVAFAATPLMMYLSAIGHVLAAGIHIAITTILSKLVGRDDLSHVLSVASCLEAIEPLIAAPFFNSVYQATIETFPGCVFLMEAVGLVIIFICFLSVIFLQRKDERIALAHNHSNTPSSNTLTSMNSSD